jgi:putative tricarboxylic transport membrane protein
MRARRCNALSALIVVVTTLLAANAHAQAWKPDRPIEIVIGTSPGGPQDRLGRLLQKVLHAYRWVDVPLSVVNKAGGGGAIADAYISQHPGDGRYVLINGIPILTNYIAGKSAFAYTDFTPLAVLGIEYVSATVRTDSPIKSGRELVERLRKDPASLSVAIGTALGNSTHISFALAMKSAGVDIRKLKTVVFNSGGDSMTALLGGHVDIAAAAPSSLLPHVQAGKLRILAIGAPQRGAGELANVPTWQELGITSSFELWRGLAGPKGMSASQIAYWDDLMAKVVKTDEWRKDLEQNQIENIYKNSTETAKHWKRQYEDARTVLTELGLAK